MRYVQHVIDRFVEERTVVADDEYRFSELAKVALEPVDGLEVEMVGRLIEQHYIGRCGELAGQSDPPTLATAQILQRAGLGLFRIEAKSLKHGIYPGMEIVPAHVGEPLLVAAELVQIGLRDVRAELG